MADPQLLLLPGVAARIATWAAQDGRDDALERGDAAAEVLAAQGLWGWGSGWSLAKMDYDASLPSTRREFWASGEGLKNAPLLDSTIEAQSEELYNDLYPGLVNSWPVRKGQAVAAALKGLDALALLRGRAAARGMADAKVWNIVELGRYLAKPDADKLAFWRSGGDDLSVKASSPITPPSPAPPPAPASSGKGLFALAVGAAIAGVWWWRSS